MLRGSVGSVVGDATWKHLDQTKRPNCGLGLRSALAGPGKWLRRKQGRGVMVDAKVKEMALTLD